MNKITKIDKTIPFESQVTIDGWISLHKCLKSHPDLIRIYYQFKDNENNISHRPAPSGPWMVNKKGRRMFCYKLASLSIPIYEECKIWRLLNK